MNKDNITAALHIAQLYRNRNTNTYRISSYSFRGNYSFLNLEIQRSHYIRPKVTVHKGAETIQGRKLFKGGNYMRKYGMYYFNFLMPTKQNFCSINLWNDFVFCFLVIVISQTTWSGATPRSPQPLPYLQCLPSSTVYGINIAESTMTRKKYTMPPFTPRREFLILYQSFYGKIVIRDFYNFHCTVQMHYTQLVMQYSSRLT